MTKRLVFVTLILSMVAAGCAASDAPAPPTSETPPNEGIEAGDDGREGPNRVETTPDEVVSDPLEGVDVSCVGELDTVLPTARTLTYKATAVNYATGKPIAGVSIKACPISDRHCAQPADETITAEDGSFVVLVPAGSVGWDGYFEVSHDHIRNALVFFSAPLTEDAQGKVQLFNNSTVNAFAEMADTRLDPQRGHMVVTAQDCAGEGAEGMALQIDTADSDSRVVYTRRRIPAIHVGTTDESGQVGAFNLPSGTANLNLTHDRTRTELSTASIFIRPGYLSQVGMAPLAPRANDLSCLGKVETPKTEETGLLFSARVREFVTRRPLVGVEVSVCARKDLRCEEPLVSAITNESGTFTAIVPLRGESAFDGYLHLSHPEMPETLIVRSAPVAQHHGIPSNIYALTKISLGVLASLAEAPLDPARGHVAAQSVDCAGQALEGARIQSSTTDKDTTRAYIAGGVPSAIATQTDHNGIAGFFNLPDGATRITTSLIEDGTPVSAYEVPVIPGGLTIAVMAPTP